MTQKNYDLTILGGGSGGLTAARIAASLGARVLLVDKERLGGDCLYTGCVPSKSLIHVARIVQQTRATARFVSVPSGAARSTQTPTGSPGNTATLTFTNADIDIVQVASYIQEVIAQVQETERVYTTDVTVKFGKVFFKSPTTLQVNEEQITSRATIIATGSHPSSSQIEGLAEIGYMTSEDVFQLTELPASLVIVGAGPIGVELGQALARLGVQVTLVQRPERILPKEEPEVSDALAKVLQAEGVKIVTNAQVLKAERVGNKKRITVKQGEHASIFEVDEILLAAGRQPNIDGLHLEAAGVVSTARGITVNEYLQTSTASIFALGDVIGGYLFTHVAAYQAGIAARNALLPSIARKKVDYRVLPWCTFTDPEVARVGMTYSEAQQKHTQVRVVTLPWSDIDRAQTEHEPTGFIKLVLAGKKEQIVGAHMFGAHAGELLGEVALAMQQHLSISDILAAIHPYPTLHTGLQQAVFEAYLSGKTAQSNRRIVKTFLRLQK